MSAYDLAPRLIGNARPGYWLVRLVKGGPEVPAAIVRIVTTSEPGEPDNPMERSPFLAAYIGGKSVQIDDVWLRRGRIISEAEYRFRCADHEWATQYAPNEPQAAPERPIDLNSVKAPF